MPDALSFLNFRIIDVLDILIVAILLYELYKLTKGTAAVKLFWIIALFYVVWKAVAYLHFTLLSELLGEVINVGILAIIILFAPEIRKFLLYIGDGRLLRFFNEKLGRKEDTNAYQEEIEAVRDACHNMSATKTGALIIFARKTPLDEFLQTGKMLDARPNSELLENIFFKNSPLHDGAMIISNNKITAAACILPISHDLDIPKEFGLRHRAAKGISQETDALSIVVSEETGSISAAYNDVLKAHISAEELEHILMRGKF